MRHSLLIFTLLIMGQLGFSQTIGSMAPDFTLKNTQEQEFTLSHYKGKVIAVFMLGYGCPSCKGIAESVQSKLAEEYKSNQDFVIVGIDAWDGTKAQVESFKSATNVTFDILQKGSQVAKAWGTTYDRIIVIDRKGNLVFKGDGLVSSHLDQATTAVKTALQTTATSIGSLDENSFSVSVFPNPVLDMLNVNFTLKEAEKVSIRIIDLSGKTLISLPPADLLLGEHSLSIDAGKLNRGLHLISMQIGNKLSTQKFMVK